MFGKKKIIMDDLQKLRPTSKLSLKLSCISIADGDVDQAQKIYDFFAKDMNLPDVDPVVPSTFEQVKNTVGNVFGWVKSNQDDIVQAINIIQTLRGKSSIASTAASAAASAEAIPPLPNE